MTNCKTCEDHGVVTPLIWNPKNKSPSGKMIPMEADGKNHTCPFRPKTFTPRTTAPAVTTNAPSVSVSVMKHQETLAAETSEVMAALNRMEGEVNKTLALRDDIKAIKEIVTRLEQSVASLILSPPKS